MRGEGLIVGQSRKFKIGLLVNVSQSYRLRPSDWDSNLARSSEGLRKPEDTKVIFYQLGEGKHVAS